MIMVTQEDVQLLLTDLCARLPYGVKFRTTSKSTTVLKSIGIESFGLIPINLFYKRPQFYLVNEFHNLEYKPYLRPLSAMTKEEQAELLQLMGNGNDVQRMDFYYSHHLDIRGLIGKGLAVEAPADMYIIKTQV